jgi:hypothetical protein
MMASTHASRGSAQKKVMTYGKSSRARQLNHAEPLPETPPGPPRLSETQMASRSISTSQPQGHRITNPRTARAPSGKSSPGLGSRSVLSSDNDTRKRKRPASLHSKDAPKTPARKVEAHPAAAPSGHTSEKRRHMTQVGADALKSASTAPNTEQRASSASQRTKIRSAADISGLSGNTEAQRLIQKKPRLIDRLAAQKPESSGSDLDSAQSDSDENESNMPLFQKSHDVPTQQIGNLEREIWPRAHSSQTRTPTGKKIRHTYSQARSIRDDTKGLDDPFAVANDLQPDILYSSPPRKLGQGAFDFPGSESDPAEESDDQKLIIKSVHELRRAGANNRFSDEMEDLSCLTG